MNSETANLIGLERVTRLVTAFASDLSLLTGSHSGFAMLTVIPRQIVNLKRFETGLKSVKH